MSSEFNKAAGRKYELIASDKPGLFRVRALRSFGIVFAGEIGGYVEGEHNLSHDGWSWVGDDAVVRGDARVLGGAIVWERAQIGGKAIVTGGAVVGGDAQIHGEAIVCDRVVRGGRHEGGPRGPERRL